MRRRWFLFSLLGLFFVGLWILDARPSELIPHEGGKKLAGEFLSAAIKPAFDFEDTNLRDRDISFAGEIGKALWTTIRYAAVAMSLSLVLGITGGILGSRAWWNRPHICLEVMRIGVRLIATGLRSVHELLWALFFLAAVGTSPIAAIFAIALPYGGTLAKVFSELLDEASSSAASVMKNSGASGITSFLATASQAAPDLITYTLYRFECAVRSSAVLGFVGIPTIGYHISNAFEDGHYREIWTYLYAILIVVILIESWGMKIREVLTKGTPSKSPRSNTISDLKKARSRSLFLRVSFALLALATTLGWILEDRWGSRLSFDQRLTNFTRFIGELTPAPVQKSGDWGELFPWLSELMTRHGNEALWQTFHLGTAAAILAGATALLGLMFGARSLASKTPRGVSTGGSNIRIAFGTLIRFSSRIARAMPEYILAFLLLGIFGPTIWALLFPLAIHNGGILLRLGAEVVDNVRSPASATILAQGGSRSSAFLTALLPESFNRLLLFLFYRWESCIREATVLGMLSVASLGALIADSRAGLHYDQMLLWMLLGATLVFVGDITSDIVRHQLRGKN